MFITSVSLSLLLLLLVQSTVVFTSSITSSLKDLDGSDQAHGIDISSSKKKNSEDVVFSKRRKTSTYKGISDEDFFANLMDLSPSQAESWLQSPKSINLDDGNASASTAAISDTHRWDEIDWLGLLHNVSPESVEYSNYMSGEAATLKNHSFQNNRDEIARLEEILLDEHPRKPPQAMKEKININTKPFLDRKKRWDEGYSPVQKARIRAAFNAKVLAAGQKLILSNRNRMIASFSKEYLDELANNEDVQEDDLNIKSRKRGSSWTKGLKKHEIELFTNFGKVMATYHEGDSCYIRNKLLRLLNEEERHAVRTQNIERMNQIAWEHRPPPKDQRERNKEVSSYNGKST